MYTIFRSLTSISNFCFQNVVFYVISDDIKKAKITLLTLNDGKHKIVFPGARNYGIKSHAARKFVLMNTILSEENK